MEITHQIVSMERGATKGSGSPMWRCQCLDGVKVNFFKHADPVKDSFKLFQAAGYESELIAMQDRDRLGWKISPIGVELVKDGDWWNVRAVQPRAEGSLPDPVYVPDLAWYRSMVREMLNRFPLLAARCFDTETTGTDPSSEIIQISIMDHLGNVLCDTLIKPVNREAIQATTAITGLTESDFLYAPTFPDIVDHLRLALHDEAWIAYNIGFDAGMLERDLMRHSIRPIFSSGMFDAMMIFSQYAGLWDAPSQRWKNVKLSEAAQSMRIEAQNVHRANGDTLTLFELVCAMRQGREPQPIESVETNR